MRWRSRAYDLACVAAIAAVVGYLFADLLSANAFWSHEQLYVYMRADQVAKELAAGHVPQAFPDAIFGAGYAFPRFYPPFSLWLSAALSLLAGDTVVGTNVAFFLSVLLSGFAMYWMAATFTRDRVVALGASLLYVALPYRFVDIFVRGALAEAWTFFWYPIIVAGIWRAVTRRVMPWYLPVGVAGLVLTHNITAVYFLAFCALLAALGLVWDGWRGAALAALGLGLGMWLAAWFLLPQQHYLENVWVGDSTFMWADAAHVQFHRVYPHQFFFSWPTLWFGESQFEGYLDEMSYELGVGQLLLVPLASAFLVALWRRERRIDHFALVLAALCAVAWTGSLAFMLYPKAFLALLPSAFAYIQFPWRLLGLAIFFSVTAAALLVRFGGFGARTRYAYAAAALLLVAFVPAFERTAHVEPNASASEILEPAAVREAGKLGFTVLGEYLPREFDLAALRSGDLAEGAFERPILLDGSTSSLTAWRRSGLDMDATVEGDDPASVVFPLVYYDFYHAESATGARLETFSSNGMLAVRVPPGGGEVRIRQHLTPVSRTGLWTSLVALVAIAACSLLIGRRRRAWMRLPAVSRPSAHDTRPVSEPIDAEGAAGAVDGRG